MSSFAEAFSCNDYKASKSDEESSTWTTYLEDLVNCNPEHCAVASRNSTTDESCTSMVSDHGVTPAATKFGGGVDNMVGLCRPNKISSFKKRKKIMNTLVDHDLADTATSPVNTPQTSNKYSDAEMNLKHKPRRKRSTFLRRKEEPQDNADDRNE